MSPGNLTSEPRIVAGVDGSPSSKAGLRWALRQSRLTGATIDAVIAWQTPAVPTAYGVGPVLVEEEGDFEEAARKTLEAAINDVAEPTDSPRVRAQVVRGDPARVLLGAATGADLLVVGNRGHSALASVLLGSVSQHCVHHAHCPVLVMRDE
jgi:nucleotide-binding universal stress UspA family protein